MTYRPLPTEVLYQVAEFFTPGQAANPCLVSRDWHNVFADRIWSKCTLSEHGRLPPVEGLIRNANHVTELYLFGTDVPQGYLSVPFTRLTRLVLHHCTHASNKDEIARYVAQLVASNNFLHELVLDDPSLSVVREIWQCISIRGKDSKLKRVAFGGMALTGADFAIFWQSCCRAGVQHLKITGFRNTDEHRCYSPSPHLELLPELQSMSLDQSMTLFSLLLCPNLRKLELNCQTGLAMLADLVVGGYLTHLDCLDLTQIGDDLWTASLVEAMNHIKEFVVRSTQPISRISEALKRHFATLRVVSFTMECEAPQGMSLMLLESCPLLSHVCGPPITASEIIHGTEPWACMNLQSFKIFIALDTDAVAAESRKVFERLAELECLTELSIRPPSTYLANLTQGLALTLASGMGQLSTLARLVKLDFTFTVQDMSSADVAWMKKHWKRLDSVLGLCNDRGGFRQQPNTTD
ncbi:hypothetical protein BG000_009413 [Podila horticola]|nr:hypothetical protein BG000_009413 [Podila horticola]